MKRHCICISPDMAGDYRHGAKLTHSPGITENESIDQAPFDIWQCYPEKGLPAAGTKNKCSLFFICSLGLHQRYQFSRNKRKSDKQCGNDNTGYSKNYLYIMR